MSRWIDITDDVSKKYYNAFIKQVSMPEYVKVASVLTEKDLNSISSDAFADSLNRKFAVNTKANCWCSALYFYGNQCNTLGASKQAEAKLLNAARIWGIADDVENIKQAFEMQTIPVSYAISFEYKGAKIERCPDHTKEAATASAEWMYTNRTKFPLAIQKQAAARLIAKANFLNLTPSASTYLDKLVNPETYANINCKVAMAITDRLSDISTVRWGNLEDELLKVANDLNSRPFEVCHSGELISNALEALDVKHGLNAKWGSALQYPVEACLRVNMTKAAAAADAVIHLTTGMPVDLTKISDHQLEKGLKIAGDDFLSYCQTDGFNVDRGKAAEILPTLPKPEAQRFEAAIKTAGYIPDTTDDLLGRIFKESNAMGVMGAVSQQPQAPVNSAEPMPMQGEDDAAFEARMADQKEQANLDSLDAQAGLAAVKARKAKQQYHQNLLNQPQLGEKQAYGVRDTYEYLDRNPALFGTIEKDQVATYIQALIDVAKKRNLELTFSSGRYGVDPMSSEEALARVLKAKSMYDEDLPHFLGMRSTNGQPIDYDNHPESEAWDLWQAHYDSAKNKERG
jgi:uncharacterized protein (DUF1778 family)